MPPKRSVGLLLALGTEGRPADFVTLFDASHRERRAPREPSGQFSKVQSGKMGPGPGRFELSKGTLR